MTTQEEILFRLGLDATSMEKGFRKAEETAKDWAKDVAKTMAAPFVGILAADKLKELTVEVVEMGKQIKLSAEETGTSTEFIQGLSAAAIKLGIDGNTAAASMAILARKVGEARVEGGEAAKVFEKWGIDINGKSQEEIFYEIANTMHGITDPAQRSAMAFDLMGKGAKEMAVGLSAGADALRDIIDSAAKLNEDDIEKLHDIGAKMEEVGRRSKLILGQYITSGIESDPGNLSPEAIRAKELELSRKERKGLKDLDPELAHEFYGEKAIEALKKERKEQEAKTELTQKETALITKAAAIREKNSAKELGEADRLSEALQKHSALAEKIRREKEAGQSIAKDDLELAKLETDIIADRAKLTEAINKKDREAKAELHSQEMVDKEEKRKADETIDKTERLGYLRKERSEDMRDPAYSSIQELAEGRDWGGKDYSATARRIVRDHADAKRFAGHNEGRVTRDLEDARNMTAYLEKSGVIKPEHQLEAINQSIIRLQESMTRGGIKILDDDQGGFFQPGSSSTSSSGGSSGSSQVSSPSRQSGQQSQSSPGSTPGSTPQSNPTPAPSSPHLSRDYQETHPNFQGSTLPDALPPAHPNYQGGVNLNAPDSRDQRSKATRDKGKAWST